MRNRIGDPPGEIIWFPVRGFKDVFVVRYAYGIDMIWYRLDDAANRWILVGMG